MPDATCCLKLLADLAAQICAAFGVTQRLRLYRLSQSESALMDPQGRILLEQCSLALRDAEARSEQPAERETGVYVGVMHMEYIQYMTGEAALCLVTDAENGP